MITIRIALVACMFVAAGCSRTAPTDTAKSESPSQNAVSESVAHVEPAKTGQPAETVEESLDGATVLNFRVTGMHCDGCAQGLKSKLVQIDGVLKAEASYDESSATVMANDPAVAEKVLETIRESLYEGELIEG